MISNYNTVRNLVKERLNSEPKPLREGIIEETIHSFKNILEDYNVSTAPIFTIYNLDKNDKLDSKDWELMIKEIETYFDVVSNEGYIVQGEEQKERDLTWWSLNTKVKGEKYYFTRYLEYMSKELPSTVLTSIDKDTDVVMDHIGNPGEEDFRRYGMVVGHVQSGKTANYSALLCKAADAGYKFIVVVAGGMNNLRNQTQERINEAFIGRDLNQLVGVGLLGDSDRSKVPLSLTTRSKDFNKWDADKGSQGVSLDNIKSPVIIVIKKNTSTLENVIKWLSDHYSNSISNHSMLLIDDESDYASINTKNEEDPTQINSKIRKLLNLFKKSSYVAYTATPYANIFIDHNTDTGTHGKDLFPEDFIYALSAPSNYFGAEKIFLDDDKKHFIPVNDFLDILPMPHKKDHRLACLPDSLEDAIRLFVLNVAVRYLRNQIGKHNSMLIHITRFTDVHKNIYSLVSEYFENLKKNIVIEGKSENNLQNSVINSLHETFITHHTELEFSWEKVFEQVMELMTANNEHTIRIYEVHSETINRFEYRKDTVTNAIVVGGTSLSRGFTLEGLSVSYFLRTTIFYDTLMQMGRWFGYRMGYEDLCRIYMTEEMFNNFRTIIEATNDLIMNLKQMSIEGMTPRDFGLAVQHHPDSGLQVTARNKLKSSNVIDFEMKLDGHLKETSWISKDVSINNYNIELIQMLINTLIQKQGNNKNNVWRKLNKEIILDFIENFQTPDIGFDDFGIKSRMPIKFIKEYLEKIPTEWDVALFSGTGNEFEVTNQLKIQLEKRSVVEKNGYFEILNRQVSSGDAELVSILDQEEFKDLKIGKIKLKLQEKNKDISLKKLIRYEMERPLLMLHLIEPRISTEEKILGFNLAAFGISFPGGINSNSRNIKLQVNSVYIEKELELLEGESSDD